MGTTPAWAFGYVPTAQEWTNVFASKLDDLDYQYAAPASGSTLTSGSLKGGWILEPLTDIASLTVVAPVGVFDRQVWVVSSTKIISAFQAQPAGSQHMFGGGPFVLAGPIKWIFRLTSATWHRWL